MNMDTYILSVCGAAILSAVAAILLPESKLGKFIGGMIRIFCLLVIVLPLPSLIGGFLSPEEGENTSAQMPLDEEFMQKMFSLQMEGREELIADRLEAELGIVVSARMVWGLVEYECKIKQIEVSIENFGIYGEDEHIFVIEQVKSIVFAMYGEEVVVYE